MCNECMHAAIGMVLRNETKRRPNSESTTPKRTNGIREQTQTTVVQRSSEIASIILDKRSGHYYSLTVEATTYTYIKGDD
jgi:hypothetical protein